MSAAPPPGPPPGPPPPPPLSPSDDLDPEEEEFFDAERADTPQYSRMESGNVEAEEEAPPPPLTIKMSSSASATADGKSPGRMTRRERRKMREKAKLDAAERKKEEIRQRAEAEKKKEAQKKKTLAKKGKSFRKRQAKKRATVLFMQDPSMGGLLGKIRENELDSIGEDSSEFADSGFSDDEEGTHKLQRTTSSRTATTSASVASMSETELQQLRGVFAGHDEDHDGFINDEQLHDALRALGFAPTESLLKKYYLELAKRDSDYRPKQKKSRGGKRRHKVRMDLTTFLTASKFLDEAVDCSQEITPLFTYFDKSSKGKVTVRQLKHFLQGVSAPTRLSSDEVEELFRASPLLRDVADDLDARIDYNELIESMVFA